MLTKTKTAMRKYAETLEPSHARAQCLTIANYKLEGGETIADRILRDHRSESGARRAMSLMVAAGAAEEVDKVKNYYGTFVFEDGSRF